MSAEDPDLLAPISIGPEAEATRPPVHRPARNDSAQIATRDDLADLSYDLSTQIRALEARLSDRLQFQGWALLAGVAVLLAIAAAVVELF